MSRGQVFVDRGTGFLGTSVDMGFKTYVKVSEVPEPPGLPLLSTGLLMHFLRRRLERPELQT